MTVRLLGLFAALALFTVACGDDDGPSDAGGQSDGGGASEDDGVLDVLTAPSLETVVGDLIAAFSDTSDGVETEISTTTFAGIADAIDDADVVILPSAWTTNVVEAETTEFGENRAVIGVAEGNPGGFDIQAFAPDSGARTMVCGENTSLGNFSLTVLQKSGISPDPTTVEAGCEQSALDQVVAGSLDAVLLFRNGVQLPEGAELLEIPDEQNLVITLVSAVVNDTDDAEAFGEFLDSDEAAQIKQDENLVD